MEAYNKRNLDKDMDSVSHMAETIPSSQHVPSTEEHNSLSRSTIGAVTGVDSMEEICNPKGAIRGSEVLELLEDLESRNDRRSIDHVEEAKVMSKLGNACDPNRSKTFPRDENSLKLDGNAKGRKGKDNAKSDTVELQARKRGASPNITKQDSKRKTTGVKSNKYRLAALEEEAERLDEENKALIMAIETIEETVPRYMLN